MTRRLPDSNAALAMAIALALALFSTGCHSPVPAPEEPARAVRCVPVENGNAEEIRTIRGPLRPPPDRDAPVAARVAGTIVAIPVREGDAVRKGAVLARLDDRTLNDERRKAEQNVAQARAAAVASGAAAARKAHLLERGIASKADAETAAAGAAKGDADVASAEAELDVARANFERARITSPIDGIVVRVFKQVGEAVDGSPGQPVVEVADPTRLELRAEVPVGDLMLLKSGQPVRVVVEGAAEPIDAKVAAVSPAVSAETGLGVVRIAIPPETGIPIGAMATAHAMVKMHDGVPLIPATALRGGTAGGLEAVVCENGKARIAAVKTGIRTDDGKIEIVSGLKAGESVIADGGLGVEDGAKVTPEKATPETDTGDRAP